MFLHIQTVYVFGLFYLIEVEALIGEWQCYLLSLQSLFQAISNPLFTILLIFYYQVILNNTALGLRESKSGVCC